METAALGAPTSSHFRALSYRFAVDCDVPDLASLVDEVFAGLREATRRPAVGQPGPAAGHRYSLTASAADDGRVDVRRDGTPVASAQRPGDAVGWVVGDVNRATAESSGEHLLFHAGALEAGGIGVLVPGTSGSGKSTLVAGLVRAGLAYLTDELAALDLSSGQLLPYAKAITIKHGSFGVLRAMRPASAAASEVAPSCAEWQVAVGPGTGRVIGDPCPPGIVVVPHYDPGGITTLNPLSETEAFFLLALNAVNLLPHGGAGTAALGQLVAGCTCVALSVSDLDAACALVLELVAEQKTPAPRAATARGG
jgi:hypothetical protein